MLRHCEKARIIREKRGFFDTGRPIVARAASATGLVRQ
jgi:hypothetical protein